MEKDKVEVKKDIKNTRKKVGISKKYTIDGYRFERYKPFKFSNIGCIQISCWVIGNAYKSTYAINRDLKRCWSEVIVGYEDGLGKRLIFAPEMNEGILTPTKSFLQIDVQFELGGLSHYMDELIYDIVEEYLIDVIENSKLVVV